MLSIATGTRIFVAAGATDMRKGFDGLQGIVSGVLEQDPLCGHLFLFVNRRRDKLKILYWDGDGLAIWYRPTNPTVGARSKARFKCRALRTISGPPKSAARN
jgi:hypothetical protein